EGVQSTPHRSDPDRGLFADEVAVHFVLPTLKESQKAGNRTQERTTIGGGRYEQSNGWNYSGRDSLGTRWNDGLVYSRGKARNRWHRIWLDDQRHYRGNPDWSIRA